MHAENIVWMGEPSEEAKREHDKHKFGFWPQYTIWPYKIKGDDTQFWMGVDTHEIYLAEKAILEALGETRILIERDALIKLIEVYGEKVAEEARSSVYEECAEH